MKHYTGKEVKSCYNLEKICLHRLPGIIFDYIDKDSNFTHASMRNKRPDL